MENYVSEYVSLSDMHTRKGIVRTTGGVRREGSAFLITALGTSIPLKGDKDILSELVGTDVLLTGEAEEGSIKHLSSETFSSIDHSLFHELCKKMASLPEMFHTQQ
jgi:hypothetical protein